MSTQPRITEGMRVIINDHSDAQGDKGVVLAIQCGEIVIVELDQGCVWPVLMDELIPDTSPGARERQ